MEGGSWECLPQVNFFFSFAFFRLLSLGIYIFFSCPSEFGNVYMKDEETLYLYSPLSMELNAKCGPSIENGDWKQMVSIKNRDKHKKRRMQICVFEQDLRHRREGAGCRNARRRCTRRNNPSRLSLWPCLSICISEVIVYFWPFLFNHFLHSSLFTWVEICVPWWALWFFSSPFIYSEGPLVRQSPLLMLRFCWF